jgi:leader peptidase (prepilin peptidase) / N-methyltransferase
VTTGLLVLAGLILGAIVGSFIATLCLRWPERRSVLVGRSHCDGCGRPLGARDLIPLVSATASKGRARCCDHAIHPLHRQVELAAAVIGMIAFLAGDAPQGFALALFGWLLLPLAILDLRHLWLPDRLVVLLGCAGVVGGAWLTAEPLTHRLLSGLIAGALLAFVAWAYRLVRGREGLGAGDPKLFAAIGLWLGPVLTVTTLTAAAMIGLAEAILRRRALDEARPLGTLLCLGAWLTATAAIVRG